VGGRGRTSGLKSDETLTDPASFLLQLHGGKELVKTRFRALGLSEGQRVGAALRRRGRDVLLRRVIHGQQGNRLFSILLSVSLRGIGGTVTRKNDKKL